MDDIALGLGISKKTIYQYYKDKNELVLDWAKRDLESQRCLIDDLADPATDAIKQVLDITVLVEEKIKERNPILMLDLQKFHRGAWDLFKKFQSEYVYKKVMQNLKTGIQEGLYRQDLNLEVTALLRLHFINYAFAAYADFETKYSVTELMKQFTDVYLHGICTIKGHKLINKYKHITEDE
jgi:TetR/AcrR family transcriptional regulator, cholesterol catabolism regulator